MICYFLTSLKGHTVNDFITASARVINFENNFEITRQRNSQVSSVDMMEDMINNQSTLRLFESWVKLKLNGHSCKFWDYMPVAVRL